MNCPTAGLEGVTGGAMQKEMSPQAYGVGSDLANLVDLDGDHLPHLKMLPQDSFLPRVIHPCVLTDGDEPATPDSQRSQH